jgi:hypothetical protein
VWSLKKNAYTPEKFIDATERNGLIHTAAFFRASIATDLKEDRCLIEDTRRQKAKAPA